jgi:hypothetical protein
VRKIKEVLRLRFELGLGLRAIARSCSVGLGTAHEYLQREPNGYLLGSYRIATAPDPNSSRLTSLKSTRFDSPANNVGPWPASLGCTTNSYSSINPSSANASGSFTPPTNSPLRCSSFLRFDSYTSCYAASSPEATLALRVMFEHVISRAGDRVREGCDHRDEQEEKRPEGGTGGRRSPAPTVLSRIRQGVVERSNHMGLRTAKP